MRKAKDRSGAIGADRKGGAALLIDGAPWRLALRRVEARGARHRRARCAHWNAVVGRSHSSDRCRVVRSRMHPALDDHQCGRCDPLPQSILTWLPGY